MEENSLKELDQPLSKTNHQVENPSPSSLEPSRNVALRQEHVTESQQVETPSASSLELSKDFHVAPELVSEILLRLPVKFILRFQVVSKTWRSLITRPYFPRSHLKYSNHQLLFTNSVIKHCPLLSVLHEPSTTQFYNLDCPFLLPDESISVVGSVNGLVCLINKTDLFLWNPALRESKQLPSSNISVEDSQNVHYGFGYDEVNDDYKVVSWFYEHLGDVYKTEVKVYSLRTNSWRTIEDFKGRAPMGDTGKYVSGKIHWTSTGPPDSRWDWKIVSLDMTNEIYGELAPPDIEDGLADWELGVVGGKLLLICEEKREIADLWVMKEYGVEKSWTKVASVRFSFRLPKILHILNDNEIVLASESSLQVYNSEDDEFTNLLSLTCVWSADHFYDVNVYVESLVSLAANDVADDA